MVSQLKHNVIDGVAVPTFVVPREELRQGLKIRPDTDIVVASYQKSGTTWTQNICRHLLWPEDTSDTQLYVRIPWINTTRNVSYEEFEARPNPRVMKTHDPIEWIDDIVAGTNTKIIFVYRNPKDVVVSFYKHMKMKDNQSGLEGVSFQDFYRDVCRHSENCTHGLWENHLSGYLSQRDTRNMLVLRFEDMKENLPREIKKIADFIGVKYTDDLIEDVAKKTDFNYMKKDNTCNYSTLYNTAEFMRSGKVGNWEGYLTEEQAQDLTNVERKVYEEFGLDNVIY